MTPPEPARIGPEHDRTLPAALRRGDILDYPWQAQASGEACIEVTLSGPGTSWARPEAAVVRIEIDGGEPQHIVVAGGEEPVLYARLLGRISAGPHRITVGLDDVPPETAARDLECHAIRAAVVADGDEDAFVWRHAPVLHYRALDSALDGLWTDTPLLLFYRLINTDEGRGVEYHVINSHEDAGTGLRALLARWGHTTDIEWIFRVVRDARGRIVREEFQGPAHITQPFRGGRALGGHPVLQAATRNGMVTDGVTCPYRTALAPVMRQPADEPREGVQYRFPWITRVSALEVLRQEGMAPGHAQTAARAAGDPRTYLYVHFKRQDAAATLALEALARVGGTWHASAGGRPECACRAEDAESTAIKLPPGTRDADIDAIALRSLEHPAAPATIRFVRAFCLDQAYRSEPPLAGPSTCRLSRASPQATVWERDFEERS